MLLRRSLLVIALVWFTVSPRDVGLIVGSTNRPRVVAEMLRGGCRWVKVFPAMLICRFGNGPRYTPAPNARKS